LLAVHSFPTRRSSDLPISDAIEGITHSLCTLEFEAHRPLYDWVLDSLEGLHEFPSRPRQIEFARLNLNYTVTSKRANSIWRGRLDRKSTRLNSSHVSI